MKQSFTTRKNAVTEIGKNTIFVNLYLYLLIRLFMIIKDYNQQSSDESDDDSNQEPSPFFGSVGYLDEEPPSPVHVTGPPVYKRGNNRKTYEKRRDHFQAIEEEAEEDSEDESMESEPEPNKEKAIIADDHAKNGAQSKPVSPQFGEMISSYESNQGSEEEVEEEDDEAEAAAPPAVPAAQMARITFALSTFNK